MLYYNATENCNFDCNSYFQELPQTGDVAILKKKPYGHLIVAGNNYARQVEIYIPPKVKNQSNIVHTVEEFPKTIEKKLGYEASRKQARQVNFSDFRKNNPLLSKFKDQNLKEPDISQHQCRNKEVAEEILAEDILIE